MGSGGMAMMDSSSGDIVAARGAVNHDGENSEEKKSRQTVMSVVREKEVRDDSAVAARE